MIDKDAKLESALLAEIDNSEYTSTKDYNLSMAYYNGDIRGDEIDGRSNAQSLDVADMIEALTAQIMPAFEGSDLAMFDPLDPNDEDQVRLETKYVNYVVTQLNNGFIFIQEALKNTLLMRNAVIKVYMEQKVTVEPIANADEFDDVMFYALRQQLTNDQELVINDLNIVTIITTKKAVSIESVPSEEFLYTKGWNKQSLVGCPFTAHRQEIKRHELIDMGYSADVVAEISTSTSKTGFERVRDPEATDSQYTNASNNMLDPIEYYECYYIYDYDEDGYPELIKACLASDKLINIERVAFHPFAGGTAVLMPNRFRGISTFDQQKQVQDNKTKALRQYMDNMNAMNNRRLEVEWRNIIDPNDLVDSKPGGVIKSKKAGSVVAIPVDDIGPSCEMLLGYWDKIRTNRSGASLDMVSENMPVGGETAHGAERIISSKEQIGALASNTFKETVIKDMFLLVHKTIRAFLQDNQSFKVENEWFTADPSNWRERDDVKVIIGASQGVANKRMTVIGGVIEQQVKAFSNGQGGILVNHSGVYNALVDYAKVSGIDNPSKYWMNPNSEEAQQTIESNNEESNKIKVMQEKLQLQMVKNETLRAEADARSKQAKASIDGLKLELDRIKIALDESEKDTAMSIDLLKHRDNLAMQITSLEAQYDEDIKDYKENKRQVNE